MQITCHEKSHEGQAYRLLVRIPALGRTFIRFQIARAIQGKMIWSTIPSSSRTLRDTAFQLFADELDSHGLL